MDPPSARSGRWSGIAEDAVLTVANRWKHRPTIPEAGVDRGLIDAPLLCADTWHPNYVDAPDRSEPWGNERGVIRHVHTAWQDEDEELLALHAGHRDITHNPSGYALAVLPLDLSAAGDPLPAIECGELTGALSGLDAAEYKAGVAAMVALAGSPGDDLVEPLDALASHLPASDPKRLATALRALGWTAWGLQVNEAPAVRNPRKALRERLDAHAERLEPFLAHEDAALRAAAAMAASACPSLLATIEKRAQIETDSMALASLVIGIARAARESGRAAATIAAPIKRLAGTNKLAPLAGLARAIAGDLDLQALGDVVRLGQPKGFDWFGGGDALREVAVELMEQGSPEARVELAIRLVSTPVSKDPAGLATEVGLALMFRNTETIPSLLPPGALDAAQRRVVEALVDAHAVTQPPGTWQWIWTRYSLPSDHEGRKILAGRSSSPLAKIVDLEGERLPLFFALDRIAFETHLAGRKDQLERVDRCLGHMSIPEFLRMREHFMATQDMFNGQSGSRALPPYPYMSGPSLFRKLETWDRNAREAYHSALDPQIDALASTPPDERPKEPALGTLVCWRAATSEHDDRLPDRWLDGFGPQDWYAFHPYPEGWRHFDPEELRKRMPKEIANFYSGRLPK